MSGTRPVALALDVLILGYLETSQEKFQSLIRTMFCTFTHYK
jgi:hypothetical protein